jgi:hypothetical protein
LVIGKPVAATPPSSSSVTVSAGANATTRMVPHFVGSGQVGNLSCTVAQYVSYALVSWALAHASIVNSEGSRKLFGHLGDVPRLRLSALTALVCQLHRVVILPKLRKRVTRNLRACILIRARNSIGVLRA